MKRTNGEQLAAAQAFGKVGGRTRAKNLTAARRRAIAVKAARARWSKTARERKAAK